ncbi:hypothetical protein GCM10007276_32470 [Agaricicola taiwanensis]|uniref:DUF1007 family protein n=1 Tax=Agaricicola taiwanensis TaxID=591372 RepID=A0A8J2YMN4_9RHOB|nr:DUF1007 family protein [Agaricicola taiwanensis]GGE52955.1 hypothetical protein GCM10007276_32470 [Agaricicola taiwanensis]
MTLLSRLAIAASLLLVATSTSHAHPHVWTSVTSAVVYDGDGHPERIRHAWTFDEMFSSFAVQGLDTNNDGTFDREELKDLAEVNVTSLAEFDYFTFVSAGGEEVKLERPVDYYLTHDGKALTLHFTLPVEQPDEATPGPLRVEVYDPTYFVAFTFAAGTPVTMENAPQGCALETKGPPPEVLGGNGQVPEEFFTELESQGGPFDQDFSNAITVKCPGDVAVAAPPLLSSEPADQALNQAKAPEPREKIEDRAPGAARAAGPQSRGLGALGVIRPDGAFVDPGPGLAGFIAAKQAEFYQALSSTLSRVREDGSALLLLSALGFAYGVFHAAGPGHGKVVIASYLVASGEALRRGIMISFASALAQAVTAVALVLVLSAVLGAGAQALGVTAYWLEAGSYAAIALLGVMLVWRKGRGFIAALKGQAVAHDCGPGCDHHSHMPDPETLKGPFDWRRAMAAVLAIGLRPCTGAIVVLVFALSQGILWAGVVATFAMALGTAITVSAIAILSVMAKSTALRLAGGGNGLVAVRGLEVVAGLAMVVFGGLLLAGMLAARGMV